MKMITIPNQAIKQSSNQGFKVFKIFYQWCLCVTVAALIAGCDTGGDDTAQNEQAGSLTLSVGGTLEPGGSTTANVTVNSAVAAIGAAGSTVDVTLADTSSCSPGLTISPTSQSIAIGSTAAFTVTAPNALCVHQLQASTSSLSTETPTTVTVVPSDASISVGLFDSAGTSPVTEVEQGSSIKLKFTGSNLSNVSTTQNYQAQTAISGITLSDSGQCSLSASQTTCELTVTAASDAALTTGAAMTLTAVGITTVVPLNSSELTYDVTAQPGALSAFNLNDQALNLLLLYYGGSSPVLLNTQTVVLKNTGPGSVSNIAISGTDLDISNNTCGSLAANTQCQFDVALSSSQSFGETKSLVITADNDAGDVTIPVLVGVGLAQTGQISTAPIDPAPDGSDGDLQEGIVWPSPRFEAGTQSDGSACPSGQEVIVDNLTGLMWPKNGIIGFESTDGGGPIAQPDYDNTTANLNTLSWDNALTAVSNMNSAATKLCGYSDWRLPNQNELYSLINLSQANPSIWLNNASQGFSNVQSTYYWSSSTYASITDYAWVVLFGNGAVGAPNKTDGNYVLPVRGPN